jgi:hypothetical protein
MPAELVRRLAAMIAKDFPLIRGKSFAIMPGPKGLGDIPGGTGTRSGAARGMRNPMLDTSLSRSRVKSGKYSRLRPAIRKPGVWRPGRTGQYATFRQALRGGCRV